MKLVVMWFDLLSRTMEDKGEGSYLVVFDVERVWHSIITLKEFAQKCL
jgi:hypothetical protein